MHDSVTELISTSAYNTMSIKQLMLIMDKDFKLLDAKDRRAIMTRMNWLHAEMSGNLSDVTSRRKPIEKRMAQLSILHEQAWADFWRTY